MRVGFWIATERPFDDVLRSAVEAERLGFDAIYLADHFMPSDLPLAAPRLEAWTTLGALAARTERVRLGVLVSGNTYRHPAVLAKMAATTDRISHGRVVLGLGAGWQLNEHIAYGIDLPEVPELLGRLDEACQVVRTLLDHDWSDFDGRWYHLEDAPCEPKPVQEHLPLLVGVSGEKITMGIAARHADIWNYWGTPDGVAHKLEVLKRHCTEAGRDPATLEVTTQALVRISEDPSQIAAWASEEDHQPSITGTPSQLTEELGRYEALGVDEFILPDRTLGASETERFETMARFLQEVCAPFRT